jgi:hypothetical protein
MTKRANISVYGSNDNLQLVIAIKNQPDVSTDWAIQMRRNLLEHGLTQNAPYFLLAHPEKFYLWENSKSVSYEAPPDYIIDAVEALTSYYNPLPRSFNEISHDYFDIFMDIWIRHLAKSQLNREEVGSGLAWLFDSGLYEIIKQGLLVIEIIE